MKIKREQLLQELESVTPGLSRRAIPILEQTDCFIFKNGNVRTYNDSIACTRSVCLPVEGAIPAKSLLRLLHRLRLMWLDVESTDTELRMQGYDWQCGLYVKKKIYAPNTQQPRQWQRLPHRLAEALEWVAPCVSQNYSKFNLTCIHIHPEYVEATDGRKATRYTLKTGVSCPLLVIGEDVRPVVESKPTEWGKTKEWVHFRNPQGLVISCRYNPEEYPDLSHHFDVKGPTITWPIELEDTLERAAIVKNNEDPYVTISLHKKKATIIAVAKLAHTQETLKIDYDGSPFTFAICPTLLSEMVRHCGCQCVIGKERLYAGRGRVAYVTTYNKTE